MIEFIQLAGKTLGIKEDTARSATGGLLRVIKDQVDTPLFESLTSALPGSAALVGAAPAKEAKGLGGMMGGLGGMASGLGGKLGGAVGLAGALGASGLDAGKAGPFVKMFVDFVKQKASSDVVSALMKKVPQLDT